MKIRYLRIIVIFGLYIALQANSVYSAVDAAAHWPVEVTENWNAIYGEVSGLSNLRPGDSVGVFDAKGNCYGAGLFNGTYYFLSAFQMEEGNKTNDDFPIPGFKEGDEVLFKVYSEREGKEYVVKPSSGAPYIYEAHGMYPPLKIDVAYKEGSGDDGGGEDEGGSPPPSGSGTSSGEVTTSALEEPGPLTTSLGETPAASEGAGTPTSQEETTPTPQVWGLPLVLVEEAKSERPDKARPSVAPEEDKEGRKKRTAHERREVRGQNYEVPGREYGYASPDYGRTASPPAGKPSRAARIIKEGPKRIEIEQKEDIAEGKGDVEVPRVEEKREAALPRAKFPLWVAIFFIIVIILLAAIVLIDRKK